MGLPKTTVEAAHSLKAEPRTSIVSLVPNSICQLSSPAQSKGQGHEILILNGESAKAFVVIFSL